MQVANDKCETDYNFCSLVLDRWKLLEKTNSPILCMEMEDISKLFIARMLRKKFEVFGIHISLPDPLILIIDICVESSPVMTQMMVKDILDTVNTKVFLDKGIPSGYRIRYEDFKLTYPDIPLLKMDENVRDHLRKLWDSQTEYLDENNDIFHYSKYHVDTPEYWLETINPK